MNARKYSTLAAYGAALTGTANPDTVRGTFFAKLLTENDDSGRHGVLIPTEAYEFFPELTVVNPKENATSAFESIDVIDGKPRGLNYKYYQRYPERRLTCLNPLFNDRDHGLRLIVVFRSSSQSKQQYFVDGLRRGIDHDFESTLSLIFGNEIGRIEGAFVLRAVDAPQFHTDENLDELLYKFDAIAASGWIASMRTNDTGIGHTFEKLLGIKENNSPTADFKGIEVKCQGIREGVRGAAKLNLFQSAPAWHRKMPMIQRLKDIGQLRADGSYACYSQVTTSRNNLNLWLARNDPGSRLDLFRDELVLGDWSDAKLARRLTEKHTRAVFVKAEVKGPLTAQRFQYKELVYCERPSLENFKRLIEKRKLVFEFAMSENGRGGVRNHGYPWRLTSESVLPELFSLRVRLR